MELIQTYETTIFVPRTNLGATVLVIPARSIPARSVGESIDFVSAAHLFGADPHSYHGERTYIDPAEFANVFRKDASFRDGSELSQFTNYVLNARIIPFESSPLGAESLSGIAASSVKAGTITLGATVGFIAAGYTPFLLITVPLGIVLCGASVSFARWMEENRNKIWERLAGLR